MPRGRWAAIPAAAVVIALLGSRKCYEPLTYYSSRNYVQRTNDLIRRGALRFDCRDDRIELTDQATKAERDWYAASYLQNDVELFNRNRELFGHFFVVSDCELREINPFLRTIRLPFAKTTQWLGHIEFAGGAQTPAVEVHSIEGTAILEQRVKRGQPGDVRLLGNAVGEGRIARLSSGDWLHLSSSPPAPVSETFLYSGERRYERLSIVRTRNASLERIYTEEDPLLQWAGGDSGAGRL